MRGDSTAAAGAGTAGTAGTAAAVPDTADVRVKNRPSVLRIDGGDRQGGRQGIGGGGGGGGLSQGSNGGSSGLRVFIDRGFLCP